MLVEDGEDNQRLALHFLHRAGLTVDTATNGRIAIEKVAADAARGTPYDLVLMDMRMPEMDGYAATRELRRLGHVDLPIIACTARTMPTDRAACIDAGCNDYVPKPLNRAVLLAVLSRFLDGESPQTQPNDARVRSARADDPAVRSVLVEYVAELPGQVARMTELLAKGELEPLCQLVHRLKGSGGAYGFAELTRLATRAEAAINAEQQIEQVAREVRELIDLIRRIEHYEPVREITDGSKNVR